MLELQKPTVNENESLITLLTARMRAEGTK